MKKSLLLVSCIIFGYGRVNPFILPDEVSHIASSSKNSVASSIQSSVQSTSAVSIAPTPLNRIEYGFGTLLLYPQFFVIRTSDSLKRSFALDSPRKIVLDFSKRRQFPSKKIALHHPLFTQFQLGAHPAFYRMAISVSKQCRLDVKKVEEGYQVSCLLDASSSVSVP